MDINKSDVKYIDLFLVYFYFISINY